MGFTFFKDEKGKDFFPVGLQAHNSSTGTELIGKAIQAVKACGGNCLETSSISRTGFARYLDVSFRETT